MDYRKVIKTGKHRRQRGVVVLDVDDDGVSLSYDDDDTGDFVATGLTPKEARRLGIALLQAFCDIKNAQGKTSQR